MELKTRDEQGVLVVEVKGRMDAVTVQDFDKTTQALVDQGKTKIVLDLSGLDYISSAGLRGLLALAKKLKTKQGKLSLCSLSGMVREVISLSGFDQILPIFDDLAGALKT